MPQQICLSVLPQSAKYVIHRPLIFSPKLKLSALNSFLFHCRLRENSHFPFCKQMVFSF